MSSPIASRPQQAPVCKHRLCVKACPLGRGDLGQSKHSSLGGTSTGRAGVPIRDPRRAVKRRRTGMQD